MFRFRLEKILQLKIKLFEAKKAELAFIESQIKETESELERIRKEIENFSYPDGVMTFSEMMALFESLELMRRKEKELMERLEDLRKKREKAVEELVEAHKEVKILEKLKSRKLEEFRKEMLKKEIKLLDELAARSVENA